MKNDDKIPSIVSFSPTSPGGSERQFGSHLSEDAVVMVNTKLELDVQPNKIDELMSLLHALEGMQNLHFRAVEPYGGHPSYSPHPPETIVTTYLQKVYQAFSEYLDTTYKVEVSTEMRRTIPVDLVITVPAVGTQYDRYMLLSD